MDAASKKAVALEIAYILAECGGANYSGEPITQYEHMLQTAAMAQKNGAGEEAVVAALLHDIGHLLPEYEGYTEELPVMDQWGVKDHELVGAGFLRERGFAENVCLLVAGHVKAKRYLTYKNPNYYENLTAASKKTLEYQGGIMSPEEAHEFEQDPLFDTILQLRKWEERSKEIDSVDKNSPFPEEYLELCVKFIG